MLVLIVLIVLCVLCGIEGFRLGMFIGQALDDAEAWLEAYLDGCGFVHLPELWR